MPIPHNTTTGAPYPTYADFVPPYPFDFDFEPDDTLPPAYESLNHAEPQADTAWQPWGDDADHQHLPQDCCRCPTNLVGVVAVTAQVAVFLAWLYGDLGKYNPLGMR